MIGDLEADRESRHRKLLNALHPCCWQHGEKQPQSMTSCSVLRPTSLQRLWAKKHQLLFEASTKLQDRLHPYFSQGLADERNTHRVPATPFREILFMRNYTCLSLHDSSEKLI